jgi:hypothetical protein
VKVYLGIDPGNSGALAILGADVGNTFLYDAPLVSFQKAGGKTGHALSEDGMVDLIRPWVPGNDLFACVEWAQAMPKQGVAGIFSYGTGFGLWLGVLAGMGIPRIKVRPQTWMKTMFAGHGERTKALSVLVAKQLFPNADISLKKHHGRAEALLLAEFGRRTHV